MPTSQGSLRSLAAAYNILEHSRIRYRFTYDTHTVSVDFDSRRKALWVPRRQPAILVPGAEQHVTQLVIVIAGYLS